MTAAEARRGGKPGDLDPPMEVLKANWLREVDEIIGEENSPTEDDAASMSLSPTQTMPTGQLQPQPQPQITPNKAGAKAPPTPTTPSTRSMAIDSIVEKQDAA